MVGRAYVLEEQVIPRVGVSYVPNVLKDVFLQEERWGGWGYEPKGVAGVF